MTNSARLLTSTPCNRMLNKHFTATHIYVNTFEHIQCNKPFTNYMHKLTVLDFPSLHMVSIFHGVSWKTDYQTSHSTHKIISVKGTINALDRPNIYICTFWSLVSMQSWISPGLQCTLTINPDLITLAYLCTIVDRNA